MEFAPDCFPRSLRCHGDRRYVRTASGSVSPVSQPSTCVRLQQACGSARQDASMHHDVLRRIMTDRNVFVTDRNATQRNATHDKRTRVGRPSDVSYMPRCRVRCLTAFGRWARICVPFRVIVPQLAAGFRRARS